MILARLGSVAAVLCAAAVGGAEKLPANTWVKVAEGGPARRTGGVLVAVAGGRQMLYFGGDFKGGPAYVQAFDPAGRSWADFSAEKPPASGGLHAYYQTAYDPKGNRLYCLSGGPLFSFDLAGRKWKGHGVPGSLVGMSWHAVAIDPDGRKLVVVGADKRPDNLGWSRTAVLDLQAGGWRLLPPPEEGIVQEHRRLVAAREAVIELVGRTRLAWYRDPAGRGTAEELKELADRCAAVGKMPGMDRFAAQVEEVAALLADRRTLEALRAARALQRKVEQLAEAQYPVPPSRRNAPLVFDEENKVFVLFGGDHEDYLMNDTWVLDLSKGSWRRVRPELAPSPRAGHAMLCLPGSGKLLLYEGYVQSNDNWYGAHPWKTIEPRQLWSYDVKGERWDLLGLWKAKRGDASLPGAASGFYGYCRQFFSPPALAADGQGHLVLEAPAPGADKTATWMLKVDLGAPDAARRERLGKAPNLRLYRTERFLASYCEVPDPPKPTALGKLPANRWVKLPPAPRNVAYGCRQRDWGTAVWDSENDQILLWGGGHCVRSASCPIHYSPLSGRMVEGYDADEPYSANGNGGFGSSLLNRPWIGGHAYNSYAYDPKARLLVTASGFLYDPRRMDWLRRGPMKRPFQYAWNATVMEATPHGAVVWAAAAKANRVGLWLFDAEKGWTDLGPQGKLYLPYCDSEGMTYDAKRDRLLLGWGGGYMKAGDGTLTAFDFKTRKVEKITPAGQELGRIHNTREMAYLDHADWVLFGEPYVVGKGKAARPYLRVYDCAKDRYFLLDAGSGPPEAVYCQGWCHDAKRKLIYVMTFRGDAYALRVDPASADLLEQPPAGASAATAPAGASD